MPASLPGPTERIRFRRYRTGDAAAVSEMFADPQARRFYPDMGQSDRIEGWIGWNLDNYAEHGFGLWVIEHKDEGLFLGDCGLTYQLVEGDRLLELGYHLQSTTEESATPLRLDELVLLSPSTSWLHRSCVQSWIQRTPRRCAWLLDSTLLAELSPTTRA
jgi:hypothetical protein